MASEIKFVSDLIANYFNTKLARCFYNYKNLKGFMGLILSRLYELIGIAELIHFEMPVKEDKFISPHSD